MMRKVDIVRNVNIVRRVNIVRSGNIHRKNMAAALLGAVLIVSMMPVRVLAKDRTGGGMERQGGNHRPQGDNTQAPENTMPAFKAAVENGLTGLNWMCDADKRRGPGNFSRFGF